MQVQDEGRTIPGEDADELHVLAEKRFKVEFCLKQIFKEKPRDDYERPKVLQCSPKRPELTVTVRIHLRDNAEGQPRIVGVAEVTPPEAEVVLLCSIARRKRRDTPRVSFGGGPTVHQLYFRPQYGSWDVVRKGAGLLWNYEPDSYDYPLRVWVMVKGHAVPPSPPLGKTLNAARKLGVDCDVLLTAGGVTFPAHKVVLCARSPVFRTMLSGDWKEGREGRVAFDDVSSEALARMLDFLYVGVAPRDWTEYKEELRTLAIRYDIEALQRATST